MQRSHARNRYSTITSQSKQRHLYPPGATAPAHPTSSLPHLPLSLFPFSGAFAIVRRCADRATGQAYAMKIIDKKKFVQIQQTSRPESLMDEVSILRRADHRGIIKLFDLIETPTTLYLVLELVEGGDLFDHIVAQEGKGFTEDVARHMFMQMLQAMKYLHSKNIVHRDLKPENILLVSKDSHDIRISDFGLSRVVGVGSFMKTMCQLR